MSATPRRASDPLCPTCKAKVGGGGVYDSVEAFRQTVLGQSVLLLACPQCGTVLGAIEDRRKGR